MAIASVSPAGSDCVVRLFSAASSGARAIVKRRYRAFDHGA
jgi:hypothetical protein